MPKIGLFIPCYVNQFYPQVGIATLQLLKKFGCDVHYPTQQTCCGQPMANSGYEHLTKGCSNLFVKIFSGYDYIVCPSGSCTLHIKQHLRDVKNEEAAKEIRGKVYELTEFLVDILQIKKLEASFPFKVIMHQSCHGQRGLHTSQMSELVAAPFSKPAYLLSLVKGLEIATPKRADECCGFGGTFCVLEEAVSVKMGKDRIKDYKSQQCSFITGIDMSCLMHLEGILKRQKSTMQVKHIAEILNSSNDISK